MTVGVTRPRPLTLLALALIAVALCFASSCGSDDASSPSARDLGGGSDELGVLPAAVGGYHVTRGAAPGYVPDRACRECHEQIYDGYQATGMARSFYRPDPEKAVEKFGVAFLQEETGFYYEMALRDGKYYQQRYCRDANGDRFAEYEQEVAWIIGSGNHVRTYLSQNARGEMFELPLSWYAGSGWAMSPGYEHAEHDRFERPIKRECMFCHNAYPEVPVGSDLPGEPPTFPQELPHGIGCQRCHGPGARHIEAAEDPDGKDELTRARIVNPASFAPSERDGLCMTCHLQPDVLGGGDSFVHVMDQPIYSHRPGRPITDNKVFFDFGTSEERGKKIEINHHAYRLRQSRCYTASDGALACVTCHDPHRKQPSAEDVEFWAPKCLQCHDVADGHGAAAGATVAASPRDCVGCHMAEARPRDVVGTTITDHLIRRRPLEDDLTARHETQPRPTAPLEPIPYFDGVGPSGDLLELYAGWASADRPSKDRLSSWRASLETLAPAVPYAWVTVGRALALAGDVLGSVEVLTEAERRFPSDATVQHNLALSLHLSDQQELALQHVEKALAIATEPSTLALKGRVHALMRQIEPARVALEESLRLRSNSPKAWLAYASILAELGRLDESMAAYRNVIALNPDEFEPYLMLSDIHRSQGRQAEGMRVLEHGASRSDDLQLELVTAHLVADVALRDPKRALAIARDVTTRRPEYGRAHAYLAFAMILAGEAGAGAVIESARQLGADPACCTGLDFLDSLQRQDMASANRHLARFEQEIGTPAAERLRGPIAGLLRAAVQSQPR